jgi:hypothetical protein
MSTRAQREFLKVQLLELEKLQEMTRDHPLMSIALEERQKEMHEQIQALPLGSKEARSVLFFSGEPVHGGIGIDASFASRVLEPFQSMVMADYADRCHGVVGTRGRRPGEADSRLLLTALPRGSVGLELTRAESEELFEERELADTLAHVTSLIQAAAKSDEDFASELNQTAPRVIQNLREFLEVISKGKAGLRLESGDLRCEMSPTQANDAFNRVSNTVTKEEEVNLLGIFKGVLLESWRFDFVTNDNLKIGGRIDENLTEEQVANLAQAYFNKRCAAGLLKTTVLFKNGRVRTTYTLRGLSNSPSEKEPMAALEAVPPKAPSS